MTPPAFPPKPFARDVQSGKIVVHPERFNQKPEKPEISLLEFSQIVKDGDEIAPELYIDLMRRVLPIDRLRDLTPEEAVWFHKAVAWLHDYSILLFEFAMTEQGRKPEIMGSPWLPGVSGPFIDHMLISGVGQADFSQLVSFGVPDGARDPIGGTE